MSAMDRLRKSKKDRRSGVDRRDHRPSSYRGAERRGTLERRQFIDRRDRSSFNIQSSAKKGTFFNFLFKKRANNKNVTEEIENRPGAYRLGAQSDEEVIIPRAHKRLPCEVPVQIFDRDTHTYYPATAHNYSKPGMYLESKHAPRVGSGIVIDMVEQIADSMGPDDISRYYSKVVWLKKLSGNVVFLQYGMGVKHCKDLDDFLKIFSL